MPVNTTNTLYDEGRPYWFKNRVAIAGEEVIKQHAQVFLPPFGMNPDAYKAYLMRASYFNAPGRTHEGMVGLAFKEDPKLTVNGEEVTDPVAVTKNGEGIGIYSKRVVAEQTAVGRVGLYATFPEQESIEVDPYAVIYKTEAIINWRASRIEGKEVPTMIVLHEYYDVPDEEDAFKVVQKDQYRVLALVPPETTAQDITTVEPDKFPALVAAAEQLLGAVEENSALAPKYAVIIYRPSASNKETKPAAASRSGSKKTTKNEDKWVIYSATIPTVRGAPLKEIPFVVCNLNSLEFNKLEEPPLNDQVNVALSAFRTSADLETGRHFTGLPQPCTAGFDVPEGTVMTIGSGVAWNASAAEAKAWYLEFEGKGLESLEKALETKTQQMAILGSRMLEEPKKAVESADTHSQRKVGEESNLKTYITTAERAISQIMQWIYQWKLDVTSADQVGLELNKDFSALPLDPDLMNSLQSQTAGGLMSFETYFYNLDRRGAYPEGTTIDIERNRLSEGVPGSVSGDPMDLDTGATNEE